MTTSISLVAATNTSGAWRERRDVRHSRVFSVATRGSGVSGELSGIGGSGVRARSPFNPYARARNAHTWQLTGTRALTPLRATPTAASR